MVWLVRLVENEGMSPLSRDSFGSIPSFPSRTSQMLDVFHISPMIAASTSFPSSLSPSDSPETKELNDRPVFHLPSGSARSCRGGRELSERQDPFAEVCIACTTNEATAHLLLTAGCETSHEHHLRTAQRLSTNTAEAGEQLASLWQKGPSPLHPSPPSHSFPISQEAREVHIDGVQVAAWGLPRPWSSPSKTLE